MLCALLTLGELICAIRHAAIPEVYYVRLVTNQSKSGARNASVKAGVGLMHTERRWGMSYRPS